MLPYTPFTPAERAERALPNGIAPLGIDIATARYRWPVEEIAARYRVGRRVLDRLRKLNPHGVVEGDFPARGWHRKSYEAWKAAGRPHARTSLIVNLHMRSAAILTAPLPKAA